MYPTSHPLLASEKGRPIGVQKSSIIFPFRVYFLKNALNRRGKSLGATGCRSSFAWIFQWQHPVQLVCEFQPRRAFSLVRQNHINRFPPLPAYPKWKAAKFMQSKSCPNTIKLSAFCAASFGSSADRRTCQETFTERFLGQLRAIATAFA